MTTLQRLKHWLESERNYHKDFQRADPQFIDLLRRHVVRQRFVTRNGISISIKMSETHYCEPGGSVEMWHCPPSPLLAPYGDGDDPYAHVPLEVVAGYIDSLESLGENHELHDHKY